MPFLKSLLIFTVSFYFINLIFSSFFIFVIGHYDYKFGPLGTFQLSAMAIGVYTIPAMILFSIVSWIAGMQSDKLAKIQFITAVVLIVLMILVQFYFQYIEN